MQGRTSYFSQSTSRGRLQWAGVLSEQEEERFNQYYHPGEGGNNRRGDQYGGDTFFNEGDSCVGGYEEEPEEEVSNARIPSDATEEQEMPSHKRLLVVANRLPVSVIRKDEDSWQLEINVGSLVSAISGLRDFEVKWIGWAGVIVSDEAGQQSLTKALAEKKCIPVFLNEETVNQYYNGYCNNILWPLLHYFGHDRHSAGHGYQSLFDAYKKANQTFADVVYKNYKDGDMVWCHDYHLMLLPQCLKEYNSKMKIGWFLHTPFPSSEIQKILPSRSELLRSVLAADIVGFHTFGYVRHFVTACIRILGVEGTPEGVENQGKLTRISAFPSGIDSDRFIQVLKLPRVQDYMKELRERFAGRKVVLGVDRLDKIKGIPQKMLAFEQFLEENPEWHDKVVLLQIAAPTRTDVPEYQKLTRQVHEMVGRINGKFGSFAAVPIHHLDQSLGFNALCALYAVTDVALVTSLRDGMNLVSYEFVACQDSKKGVLILSEFAGAAQSLGAGAILVNPWNISEVASSIAYALNMPSEEREKRHQLNFTHVTSHSAHKWAEMFVSELNETEVEAQRWRTQVRPSLPCNVAIENYFKSDHRLLILGFNATLTQSAETPDRRGGQIEDMELNLHPGLCEPLRKITNDPKTSVVVLSGSKRNVLDDNFGGYNMWLAAENGMLLRHTKGKWMTIMPELLKMEWVDRLKLVFEYFTERTPRSSFELRETSLLWNYKYADIDFGRLQAGILLEHLQTGQISNTAVDIFQGARSIEVRPVGVTKGAAIDRILQEVVHNEGMNSPVTYVLCAGHLLEKDEDLYSFFEPQCPDELDAVRVAVPSIRTAETLRGSSILNLKGENYFSCAVGRKRSTARYLLGSSEDVVMLLNGLAGS